MRFLVDANLPLRLAAWLMEQGHEADYSDDLLGLTATDTAIFAAAKQRGAVIVTKDRDFRLLVAPPSPPQLLWVRLGNATNARLVTLFEQKFPAALRELEAGGLHVEIEP
ncbi:MAG: DUF5615 family PIN-like protein [Hyphomonadaceae bacterium]|nr:DUF5615 family PIN-like protein [Hyphomonadaceae bacterium]